MIELELLLNIIFFIMFWIGGSLVAMGIHAFTVMQSNVREPVSFAKALLSWPLLIVASLYILLATSDKEKI